jgi:hypothetical protein
MPLTLINNNYKLYYNHHLAIAIGHTIQLLRAIVSGGMMQDGLVSAHYSHGGDSSD